MSATVAARKARGAFFTPPELVDELVAGLLADGAGAARGRVRIVDPACGDGRLLTAVGDALEAVGADVDLIGCDVDPATVATIADARITAICADALAHDWAVGTYDIVVGNPPFLSQMAAATTRGRASRHGGGPYADAAVEFLALACRLARPDGGRVALVLPQSVLGARDAGPVRADVGDLADLTWSWWAPRQQHFDAQVNVCIVGLRRPGRGVTTAGSWTRVVTGRLDIPNLDVDRLDTDGTVGDRADLNANFRDEYYALVPAVSDLGDGPPLVTSGLIDPGRCHWGTRPVMFAKRSFEAPRVDLARLEGRFAAWARRKLVPKVLVANQTRVIEAVADPNGEWIPGVPVTSIVPTEAASVWEIAAVLTSPVATIAAWHTAAGTGLSTTSVRLGPGPLAATPWPTSDLAGAVGALRDGDIAGCATEVCAAFAIDEPGELISWWSSLAPGV